MRNRQASGLNLRSARSTLAWVALALASIALPASAAPTQPRRSAAPAARGGACLDACAARRPSSADRERYAACLNTHLTQMKPRAASVKRQPAANKAALWRELQGARTAEATRCMPASLRAWTTCLSQCR